MKPQYCWDNLIKACEQALKSLGDKVLSVHPEVCFRMGYWSNEAFPARFWGSFTGPICGNKGSIDISIDFKLEDQAIEVTADVAYETGEILSELPAQNISLRGKDIIVEDEAIPLANKLIDYVNVQFELIDRCIRIHK